jgi:hypothetical protein
LWRFGAFALRKIGGKSTAARNVNPLCKNTSAAYLIISDNNIKLSDNASPIMMSAHLG